MRIAIFTNNKNYYHKPLAEGLKRMFDGIGVDSTVLYDGHEMLAQTFDTSYQNIKQFVYNSYQQRKLNTYFDALNSYTAFVFVQGLPDAFQKVKYTNIEQMLRRKFPNKPVICYSNYYLLTKPSWMFWLMQGEKSIGLDNNNFGLERYDWYLSTSTMTEWPKPRNIEQHPVSEIGMNCDDGHLYPGEQVGFKALIDFERPLFMKERLIQLKALEETNTPYTVLNGAYNAAEIKKLYRQHAIYFLAHRESFGLPIAEVQACGCYVFTPFARWAPGHYLKEEKGHTGEGRLGKNFVVYNNDLEKLKSLIKEKKAAYNAQKVKEEFLNEYSQFFTGNTTALKGFVTKLENGEITGRSHLAYKDYLNFAAREHSDNNWTAELPPENRR